MARYLETEFDIKICTIYQTWKGFESKVLRKVFGPAVTANWRK